MKRRNKFMPRMERKKSLISSMFLALALLAGCGSGSNTDARLEISLTTEPKPANDIHQAVQLELQGISKFQVELLDDQGKALNFQTIDVPAGSKRVTATFPVAKEGSYQVRSSAFTSNDAMLGTTSQTVQVRPGVNLLGVDTLGLSNLYYASNTDLPQTKSAAGLEKFLSFDQPGIALQAYCFFGYLEDDSQNQMAYFSLIQRLEQQIDPSGSAEVRLPFIMSGTGISTPGLGGFRTGGTLGAALVGNAIALTQPWDLSVTSENAVGAVTPKNETRAKLVSGRFGQKGARYKIQSHGADNLGKLMTTEILVEDTMGFVSEGFGVNAFLPNWLLPEQEKAIRKNFGGSVEKYLAATQNPMTGQGSYYYSAPFLKVITFKVTYDENGTVVSQGTGGLLWMDVVYQTFDDAATEIVKDSTWAFFIMQFPEQQKAIMTTLVGTKVSDYRVSSLFSMDAPKNPNGVLEPEHRWNLQDIVMKPIAGSEWKSPDSGEIYYTKYKIVLSGERSADLTVTMAWNDQEVNAGSRFVYEGLGNVTGTLDGEVVNGSAWLEMQPIGKLN